MYNDPLLLGTTQQLDIDEKWTEVRIREYKGRYVYKVRYGNMERLWNAEDEEFITEPRPLAPAGGPPNNTPPHHPVGVPSQCLGSKVVW